MNSSLRCEFGFACECGTLLHEFANHRFAVRKVAPVVVIVVGKYIMVGLLLLI